MKRYFLFFLVLSFVHFFGNCASTISLEGATGRESVAEHATDAGGGGETVSEEVNKHENTPEKGTAELLSPEKGATERLPESSLVKPIQLPQDEAPHNDPVEWWYYTGILKDAQSNEYGFQLVIFQLDIGTLTLFLSQFAVTDLATKSFHHESKTAFTKTPQPKTGFKVAVGDWFVEGHKGKDHLKASMNGYAIDFQLETTKPVVLQYGNGSMTLASNKPFYYYSYTRMKVTGTLKVKDKPLQVTGLAWMDHQWGTMGRPGVDFEGWDWYSLRLDNKTELMLFLVRNSKKVGDFVGGTFIRKDGSTVELKKGDFILKATGQWKSPHTKAVYPYGWTIEIPSLKLKYTVSPLLEDQEVYKKVRDKASIYWEGVCQVKGTEAGQRVTGKAYVELTGYAPK